MSETGLRITRENFATIEKGYAIATCEIDGKRKLFAAAEGQGPCYMYDYESLEKEVVWEEPGGTMSIVPIPGRNGEIFATQNFFPVFDAKESVVVYGTYDRENKRWDLTEVCKVPYLHRFDVIDIDGSLLFVGGKLCQNKTEVQDWSTSGSLVFAEIPENITDEWEIKTFYEGITKHHGYCLQREEDRFFVSGVEGLFEVTLPQRIEDGLVIEKIIDREISDMAIVDIDGDGAYEIATIEMFHGNELAINKMIDGEYKKVFTHPIAFGHVIWGGKILGEPSFIVGSRRDDCLIELITCKDGAYLVSKIDGDVGPSQLLVFEDGEASVAFSANRQRDTFALYTFTKGK